MQVPNEIMDHSVDINGCKHHRERELNIMDIMIEEMKHWLCTTLVKQTELESDLEPTNRIEAEGHVKLHQRDAICKIHMV